MKTNITSALIAFVLMIASFNYATAATPKDGQRPASAVLYYVNIHLPAGIDLCNAYQVVLIDGHGTPVAEPQGFIPGKNNYFFTESNSTAGVRGAAMIINGNLMHFICPNELNSAPVFHMGPFYTGQAYKFDLYPLNNADGITTGEKNTPRE